MNPPDKPDAPREKAAEGPNRSPKVMWMGAGVAALALASVWIQYGRSSSPAPPMLTTLPTAEPQPVVSAVPPSAPSASSNNAPSPGTASRGPCPLDMVQIKGGTFHMGLKPGAGTALERPEHPETVKTFCLDRTEVTVAAYKACHDKGQCTKACYFPDRCDEEVNECNAGKAGKENHPINCVDWRQAQTYCGSHGKRLPTEAEWELAARGLGGRTYPWGEDEPTNQLCWDGEGNDAGKGKRKGTCEVGRHPKGDTPEGVADLAGNVSEWVSDYLCPYDKSIACAKSARVERGGSWRINHPPFVRGANRSESGEGARYGGLGFRCARSL